MAAVTSKSGAFSARSRSAIGLISAFVYRRPGATLLLLLTLPLLWLLIFYILPLYALLIQSFFYIDDFSGVVVRQFSMSTYQQLFTADNMGIVVRTVLMAAAVTFACGLIAFPLAYFMARYAKGRTRGLLYLAVLLPLWSS